MLPAISFFYAVPLCLRSIKINARKTIAISESIITNFRHAIANGDACKIGTTIESTIADARHVIRDSDACKAGTTREGKLTYARHAARDSDACKAGTTIESRITNARHAIRNVDACKTGAISESMVANARDAIGNGDACKTGAIFESRTSNARHGASMINRRDNDLGGASRIVRNRIGPIAVPSKFQAGGIICGIALNIDTRDHEVEIGRAHV